MIVSEKSRISEDIINYLYLYGFFLDIYLSVRLDLFPILIRDSIKIITRIIKKISRKIGFCTKKKSSSEKLIFPRYFLKFKKARFCRKTIFQGLKFIFFLILIF